MLVAGLFMLHHNGRKLNGAKWSGKVSTALVYIVMFILFLSPIFFPEMSENIINALILLCGFAMVATLVLYVPVFVRLFRGECNFVHFDVYDAADLHFNYLNSQI